MCVSSRFQRFRVASFCEVTPPRKFQGRECACMHGRTGQSTVSSGAQQQPSVNLSSQSILAAGRTRAYLSARFHSLKSALLSVAAHMEVDAHAVAPDEGKTLLSVAAHMEVDAHAVAPDEGETSRPGPARARARDCVTAGIKPTGTFELGDSKRPRVKGVWFLANLWRESRAGSAHHAPAACSRAACSGRTGMRRGSRHGSWAWPSCCRRLGRLRCSSRLLALRPL
jgi:hypothetical protein